VQLNLCLASFTPHLTLKDIPDDRSQSYLQRDCCNPKDIVAVAASYYSADNIFILATTRKNRYIDRPL
jgi:hypothetical protein